MSHERWLVSYADFITLLFAFFVVMFASSRVDKRKMAILAASFDSFINKGFDVSRGPNPPSGGPAAAAAKTPITPANAARALTMAEMRPSMERLEQTLRSEIDAGRIELSLQARGLVLSLKESAFFASGEDTIPPDARPVLAKVAAGLRDIPGQIRLEGHTDNTPIRSQRFPSNWQLSYARSIAVLKLLGRELGLPESRFAAAGYGEHHPLAANDAPQGRARNRRVDLVILTQEATEMAPAAAPAANSPR